MLDDIMDNCKLSSQILDLNASSFRSIRPKKNMRCKSSEIKAIIRKKTWDSFNQDLIKKSFYS